MTSSCPRLAVVVGLLPVLAIVAPTPAAAAECGAFVGDEGDNLIFYGVRARSISLGTPHCPSLVAVVPDIPSGRTIAAVCWRDKDGQWHLEDFTGCNDLTPAADSLMILGGDGDDVVMPVSHQHRNEEFVCPIAGTTGTLHQSFTIPPSPPLLEWAERHRSHTERPGVGSCLTLAGCPTFPFRVTISGGFGEDELHGAPGIDSVVSSNIFGPSWCMTTGARGSEDTAMDACVCARDASCCSTAWDSDCVSIAQTYCGADCTHSVAFEADGEVDTVCGHGGGDTLVGDGDPHPFGFERISGGPGTDFCRGWTTAGAGACCSATATPGCPAAPAIQTAVCATDPYCCTTQWDGICVSEVGSIAGGDCSALPCCAPATEPGCEDPLLEALVCDLDDYCCTTQWDGICVSEVDDVGGTCTAGHDTATTTCETVIEAARTDAGEGATARAICADANIESLAPLPADTPLDSHFVATDGLPLECMF